MRLVLVALNARYSHTNLAIRCLRAAVWQKVSPAVCDVICREFTIHDDIGTVVGDIYALEPDIVGFSCYIWNIERLKAVWRRLRLVCPQVVFVCGGPEMSDLVGDLSSEPAAMGNRFLEENPEVDRVVSGEGEQVWAEFIGRCVRDKSSLFKGPRILNLEFGADAHRDGGHRGGQNGGRYRDNGFWVDPYTVEEDFSHRYVYLEASRGCPFHCAYCLSACDDGVRYMDVEKLAPVLGRLFQWGARMIKMVDRTFNAHPWGKRVLDIFREEWEKFEGKAGTVMGLPKARIHCEMAGDLLSNSWMEYLASYPPELIQVEIGVQTVHDRTLSAIHRRQDFSKWADKVVRLQHEMGISVHLDLIAGLPEEDKAAVLESLDRVIRLRPQRLQLGFLKMLKGSPLRDEAPVHGIVYSPDAPYEVLRTAALSYKDLLELHGVEDILDKYYNSGLLGYGLDAMARESGKGRESGKNTAYADLLSALAVFWQRRGWFGRQWQRRDLMNNLEGFLWEGVPDDAARERCIEALRFDYCVAGLPVEQMPDWLHGPAEVNRNCWEQQDKEFWRQRLSSGQTMDRRQWARRISVSCFRYNVPVELSVGLRTGSRAGSNVGSGFLWGGGGTEVGDGDLFWYLFTSFSM
ncbi:MAG: DUF4080 domain-containing protein [Peptococcaceae bacterium]|nr:DUF4080 domain-containing protein [Peptococcaceae bacterium]